MKIYLLDPESIFFGEHLLEDENSPLPPCVTEPPPKTSGKEVAQWVGSQWVVLPERPPASTPKPTLEQAKAAALAQVDERHATVINKLVGSPTQVEKDTWAMKLDAATAIKAGAAPGVAGQTFLATAGIVNVNEQKAWAKVVLDKSEAYARVIGVGEKLRSGARQAIKAATTTEEINAALEAAIRQAEAAVTALLPS